MRKLITSEVYHWLQTDIDCKTASFSAAKSKLNQCAMFGAKTEQHKECHVFARRVRLEQSTVGAKWIFVGTSRPQRHNKDHSESFQLLFLTTGLM